MASSLVHHRKHDVFISFRGSDIRQGFLSHLHKALLDQHIEAFVDEQLERGKEISESLLGKIEESHIAVVIFSQDYAYSEWCLEELLKIAECRNMAGQIVIPVFYRVDPSHVQDLTGSYGDAMAQHRTKFDEPLVEKWGSVLKETASLSGLVSSDIKSESNLIEEIIKQVIWNMNLLFSSPSDSNCEGGLVGINSRVEEVKLLLRGTEDVSIVGIWGEGGIGKTTLARATFDRIRSKFDRQCFVGNVREKCEKFTADTILKVVVSDLFGTSNSDISWKWLSRKKVILVLDDVSDMNQIKSIVGNKVFFGCGSRIIITSRDSHVLNNLGAKIYAIEKLGYHEAFELFCLNAFDNKCPREGFLELSKRAVEYAQGLPLAVEVLGSNLFQRSVEEWEDELKQLKGTSDQKIHKILRISYDGLRDGDKEIFLDIACFLKWRQRDEVESLLDVRGSKIGISRLVEKTLISISFDNFLNVHDLIQQMEKDIICEEKAPEKRRWLWDPEEISFLLTREMGTDAVRGISLDMSNIESINLSPTAFAGLYKLKYLDFYASSDNNAQVCVPRGLQYLPEQLRYFRWSRFPSKSMAPTSFFTDELAKGLLQYLPVQLPYLYWSRFSSKPIHPTSSWTEKLVELDMRDSQLERLWDGVQNLPNLQRIDLSGSTKLIEVPDLSRASNLQFLTLMMCTSLVQIPYSLTCLSKLIELRLGYSSSIKSLPDDISNLKSLSLLDVSYCKKLRQLPHSFGNLESLSRFDAFHSGLKVLPESFCNLKACTWINVTDCIDLHRLPQNLGNVESLQYLHADGNQINEVTPSINNLRELRQFSFSGCKDLILPPLIGDFPYLTSINLTNCGIPEFPDGLCSVKSLTCLFMGGNDFESIPESIQQLLELRALFLNNCKNLKFLPESVHHLLKLEKLVLYKCKELLYLPESISLVPQLRDLDLRECTSLDLNQCSEIMDRLIVSYIEEWREGIRWIRAPIILWYPGSEVPEIMIHKNNGGSSLSFSFELLQRVDMQGLEFFTCLVFGWEAYADVTCEGNFIDKSGLSFAVEGCGDCDLDVPIQSKHVLISSYYFSSKNFVKGEKYEVELQFKCLSRGPAFYEDHDYLWPRDTILKCGVFPLFNHMTADYCFIRPSLFSGESEVIERFSC